MNIGSLIVGLLILAAGGACVLYYRPIAENVARGVMDYDRVKIFGIVFIALGFLIMTNLHLVLLNALVDMIFPR
ncbi:hypothetical protein IJ380_02990 [Candidatus Saccharibacteria bacterium]|nr:hypothetical protein [Candidatus Saccharibacteria bacterium]